MPRKKLGVYLKHLREGARMSLRDAETKCGINYSLICRIERGQVVANPSQLELFAKGYRVEKNFVLLQAGVVELSGFSKLMRAASPTSGDLDAILKSTTEAEKRELVKHLAALRFTSPMLDRLLGTGTED